MRVVAIGFGILIIAVALTACSSVAKTPVIQSGAVAEPTPTMVRTPTASGITIGEGTPGAAEGSPTAVVRVGTPGETVVVIPQSVAAAEAEGRDFPSAPVPQASAADFRQALGSGERRCVAVDTYRPPGDGSLGMPAGAAPSGVVGLRSGEFVAGPLVSYADHWARDPTVGKLWWISLHTDRMPGLTIRAVLLDDPSISRVFAAPIPASGTNGLFYPSSVVLPHPGHWMLIATAGPDWGCFTLTLGR